MTDEPSLAHSFEVDEAATPYGPSWVDQLLRAVANFPGPAWLFYLIGILSTLFVSHSVRWIDGSLPAGSVDILRIAEASLVVLFPAVQQYLNHTARAALAGFRSALDLSEVQFEALEYRLTTVPRRSGGMIGAIGAAVGLLSLLSNPLGFGNSARTSLVAIILSLFFATLTTAFAAVFIYHTLRQLRLVSAVHRMAGQINLFQLAPVYSFSTLTARTGIAIILINSFGYVFVFFASASGGGMTGIYVLFMAFMFLVALACFSLPLNSMHDRLSDEKRRALAEVNRRLEATLQTVHDRLDKGEFQALEQLDRAVAMLISERKLLAEVSTWPWRPETLRGFISSLALPIILYIVTALLGRIIGI